MGQSCSISGQCFRSQHGLVNVQVGLSTDVSYFNGNLQWESVVKCLYLTQGGMLNFTGLGCQPELYLLTRSSATTLAMKFAR